MVRTKFIAEIGLNHNGDIDLAKKHILSAKNPEHIMRNSKLTLLIRGKAWLKH